MAKVNVSAEGEQLLASLFAEHYLALVRLAKLWVGDVESAEDVVQEVFTVLDLAAVATPVSYLRQAVVNRARSVVRHRGVERRHVQRYPPDDSEPPRSEPFDLHLASAIRQLPDRQRDVLILRFYLDWSVERVAGFLRISASAVKASTHRAVCTLRDQLEGTDDERR